MRAASLESHLLFYLQTGSLSPHEFREAIGHHCDEWILGDLHKFTLPGRSLICFRTFIAKRGCKAWRIVRAEKAPQKSLTRAGVIDHFELFSSKWRLVTCGRVPTPAACNYFPLDKNSCDKTPKVEHCLCANQLQPWFKRGLEGIERWTFPVREKHEIRRRRCYVNFINQPRPHPVSFRHHTCLMKEQLISPARRFPS